MKIISGIIQKRNYKLNLYRYYKEELGSLKMNRRMVDIIHPGELDTEMYFYYTGNYKLSPFKVPK